MVEGKSGFEFFFEIEGASTDFYRFCQSFDKAFVKGSKL